MTAYTTSTFVRLHLAPFLADFGFARKGNTFTYLSEEKVWCWATVKPTSSAELVLFQFRMEVMPDWAWDVIRSDEERRKSPAPIEGQGLRSLDLWADPEALMPYPYGSYWSFFKDGGGLDTCLEHFMSRFRIDGVSFFAHWNGQSNWDWRD